MAMSTSTEAEVESADQFAGSDLVLEQADCRVFVGDRELGTGILTITESDLCWSSEGASENLSLEYPGICVHAISSDTSSFPHPCVYILYSSSESSSSEDEGTDNEQGPPMEVRLVPSSTDQLEMIYSAICECQLLYPDPELSDSSEEEDVQELQQCPDDFFTSADGLQHLTAEGEIVLAHLESILHIDEQSGSQNGAYATSNTGQFDDADENTAM